MSNSVRSSSFLDVLMALKQNVMKDLAVADAMIVTEINVSTQEYKCKNLTNQNDFIVATKLHDVQVQLNDVVLVLFTNTDFRTNLSKLKDGQPIQTIDNKIYHSKNYGIIVGVVYRKEN